MTDQRVREQDEQHRTTRPALDVLDRDQDRLLYDGDNRRDPPIQPLTGGFDNYWMLLSWYQAAGIRTLGHVGDVLEPADILPESGITKHLLRPLAAEKSPYVRQRLVERLDDACDMAYREFRERANERVANEREKTDYQDIDPTSERNPLMRPAFRRLDSGQTGALIEVWRGFESRQEVSRWVRSLAAVSNGEKPEGLLDEIVRSDLLLAALLDQDNDEAQLLRYRFAVSVVMPSFLAAARSLHGGEHTDSSGTSHGTFSS